MTTASRDTAGISDRSLMTHRRLLGDLLYRLTRIRLMVSVAMVAGVFIGHNVLGVEGLALGEFVLLAVAILAYNTITWFLVRPYRDPDSSARANRHLQNMAYGTAGLDYLALTVCIWLLGGSRSPFLAFYLLHVVMSSLMISRRRSLYNVALAYLLLAALVVGEYAGVIPLRTPIGVVAGPSVPDGRFTLTVLLVYGILFSFCGGVIGSLTGTLRRGEEKLHMANAELERVSTLRRDFLQIAMHNLQSPVAAASMLLKNLGAGLGGPVNEQQQRWIDRSLKRLAGVSTFLQDLQMLSTLETRKLDAEKVDVDMAEVLRSVVDDHREMARGRSHRLHLELREPLPPVHGIARLLREAVVNYVTNAIKYTQNGGSIVVRAWGEPGELRIDVQDDGIGISQEDQKRLFREFVRVRRQDSPVGEVSGSGIGLSIVKRVIESHGGRVSVQSEVDGGSTFSMALPSANRA